MAKYFRRNRTSTAVTRSQKSHEPRAKTTFGTVSRADTSRQNEIQDEFTGVSAAGAVVVTPPYDITHLARIFDKSNILRQCVEAYVTNIAYSGWEVGQADKDTPIDDKEKLILQSIIDDANLEESLTTLHGKIVEDYERFGFAFLEVIRDKKGSVSVLRHSKSINMRLAAKDMVQIPITYDVARGARVSTVTEFKIFRRFLLRRYGRTIYFKEFGDPRRMSYLTGEYEDAEKRIAIQDDDLATEIIQFKQYSDEPYGIPRWISQLPSILGSREAEEVNLRYFEDNTVPPLMMLVSGGRLTKGSYQELTDTLSKNGIGKDRQHQVMLIEAVAEGDSLDDKGSTVTVKVEKLTDSRQSDGLFKAYDDANQSKICSAFRLPPIAVGRSDSINFATAKTSAFVVETQVYAPMRARFAEIYNKLIVGSKHGLGLKTVVLVPSTPIMTDPESLMKSFTALNVMGAITPRIARESSNKILQTQLPELPAKEDADYQEWMDMPIMLSLKDMAPDTPADPATDPNADPLGGTTHDMQGIKDPSTKLIEGTGDPGFQPPEHGEE